MKRISLLAVMIVMSLTAGVRADQYRRLAQNDAVPQPPADTDVVAEAEAAGVESHAYHSAYQGFAWAQCCEPYRHCCMHLWDNYCFERRSWNCGIGRCHGLAKCYRCGSGCGRGCGHSSGCCASSGHGSHDPIPPAPPADDVQADPTDVSIPHASWVVPRTRKTANNKWVSPTAWKK